MGVGRTNCDFSELIELSKRLQNLNNDMESIMIDLTIEISLRLLRKIRKRTPVGDYSKIVEYTAKIDSKHHKKGDVYKKRVNPSGRHGGTLRRSWEIGELAYHNGVYSVEIINNVKYAPYVEYGHRTRNHKGWVPGKYMMTISEKEIGDQLDKIVRRKLELLIKEALNGK